MLERYPEERPIISSGQQGLGQGPQGCIRTKEEEWFIRI